jgi:immunity protein Imm1 of predicted polymorphic toxin system
VASRTENGAQLQRSLNWDQNEVAVGSVQELDALLDRLTREAQAELPFVVSLAREDGSTLSIGLGREESVANYVSGSWDPPYYVSRGDPDRTGAVEFVYSGEMTEYPPWSAIPAEDAREAMRHFFTTGELSPKLEWAES